MRVGKDALIQLCGVVVDRACVLCVFFSVGFFRDLPPTTHPDGHTSTITTTTKSSALSSPAQNPTQQQ
eukprot:scaffold40502_cov90-Cyclotella_meneghiniana.AAC.3